MIVALDIGGHHVAGALLDEERRSIVGDSYRHRAIGRHAGKNELLDAWAGLISELVAEASVVEGIGIAMPGPFDYREGVAYFKGNGKFECLYGTNVRQELRDRVSGDREIRFLNDATAFAVGCVAMGAAPQSTRVLALTLGTGLGAAFLENGIPVIEERPGEVPPFGSLWHLPFRDGIADDYVSTRWLLERAEANLGGRPAGVAELAARARGSENARGIFEQYGANLAAIVAPWATGFGAEAIMLGGRITGAFDLFSPALRQGLAAKGFSAPVLIHESTEDAAIVGAAQTFDPAFWAQAESRLPTS
jgi:glucokinase